MFEQAVALNDERLTQLLFGNLDEVANAIENSLAVTMDVRDSKLLLRGDARAVAHAAALVDSLTLHMARGTTVDRRLLQQLLALTPEDLAASNCLVDAVIATTHQGDKIIAKSRAQADYLTAIANHDIVFGIGPAGTGKTFVAVAAALSALKLHSVDKVIITRPAVEAGEHLGYLPGDLKQKIAPYLKPIDDVLKRLLGRQQYDSCWNRGAIEIIPLAYMRGRTLDRAFIILDEAQNTSIDQMKMFLTRIGSGSKIVVNGDVTQVDLQVTEDSGLVHASEILTGINGIAMVNFSERDVIRHQLVKDIIAAYRREEVRGD